MPWESHSMSEIRNAFIHHVLALSNPVALACRNFGISRKTAYKWLTRYRNAPNVPLLDLSRRPRSSPLRTAPDIENLVLSVRTKFGWGPRKIHAHLVQQQHPLPSVRTVAAILKRHHCINSPDSKNPALQRFERAEPNELWQCDFKGYLEVARQRVFPFTVLDDHSRYLFAVQPCLDQTMNTAWEILWLIFGEVGLPEALLCDNAFGNRYLTPGLSWFEARLVRLHIRPVHGRPYHPQTQGKIERLHGTLEKEVWPRVRRDHLDSFNHDVRQWRVEVYNALRPHEALGDRPPLSRWKPSPRRRPDKLPPVEYPPDTVLRKVAAGGDIQWNRYRILAGCGLVGEWIRVEERDHEVALFFATKEIRCLPTANLELRRVL
jgi:transposase InsO family protein